MHYFYSMEFENEFFIKENENLISFLSEINKDFEETPFENVFFEKKNENHISGHSLEKGKTDPPLSKGNVLPKERSTFFFSSFLLELIPSVKKTLFSIRNLALLALDKMEDMELKRQLQANITEDIKKIDSVLNSLLNYIHINTPIIKTNTISIILEEVLEANEKQLHDKGIKIFKKSEKEVPEIYIHDEQVKFILNSILQYAILSTPINGMIGFLIKSSELQTGISEEKDPAERNGACVEVVAGFTGGKKPTELPQNISETSFTPEEEPTQLILRLIKEILQRNRGMMIYEVDPEKPKTLITLRFPVENRTVVYYEQISM
jgi:hypothetical protein